MTFTLKLARFLVLVFALVATVAAAQQTIALRGVVQNERGLPVEGISIAQQWIEDGKTESGPIKLKPYKGATSDNKGRFVLEVSTTPGFKTGLMATSADRSLGWVGAVDPDNPQELKIVLGPMRTVRLRAVVEGITGSPEHTNGVVWIGDINGPILTQFHTYAPEFELRLPQGTYSLRIEAKDSQSVRREVDLSKNDVNLGEMKLKRAVLPSLIGKVPPPLEFTESRGVPQDFLIEDLRGKWVILEFWGYW